MPTLPHAYIPKLGAQYGQILFEKHRYMIYLIYYIFGIWYTVYHIPCVLVFIFHNLSAVYWIGWIFQQSGYLKLRFSTPCLPCLSEDGWRIRHLWQICQNSSICFPFLHFVIHASKVEEIVRIAGERGILSVLDMHQDVFNRLNCFFQTGWIQMFKTSSYFVWLHFWWM